MFDPALITECSVADNSFFDEQSDQSKIKAAIVSKYFWAWAKVITGYLKGSKKDTSIQYIDLFAGPGRYKNGTKSTPILILEQAIGDPLFRGGTQAVKGLGGKFILPFTFKNETGNRTSHHLIFVSKHPRGYEIMKEIMAKESSSTPLGVPSFEYNPAEKDQMILFGYGSPAELEGSLLQRFSGRIMTMIQVFDEHNVGTPYIKKNYKDVLTKMEKDGTIVLDPPLTKRPKRKGEITCGDQVRVTFPQTT
jgi:hypothetical protein